MCRKKLSIRGFSKFDFDLAKNSADTDGRVTRLVSGDTCTYLSEHGVDTVIESVKKQTLRLLYYSVDDELDYFDEPTQYNDDYYDNDSHLESNNDHEQRPTLIDLKNKIYIKSEYQKTDQHSASN